MNSTDWSKVSEQIRDMVQNAVDSNDFKELSRSVGDAVNDAVNSVAREINLSINKGKAKVEPPPADPYRRIKWEKDQKRKDKIKKNPYLPANPPGEAAGLACSISGYIMTGIFGIALIPLVTVFAATGMAGMAIPVGIVGSLFGVSLITGLNGSRIRSLTKKYRRYARELQGREYCRLEELAMAVARPVNEVRKDVKKMIHKGMFPQGHLDRQESCLMISNEAYRQYQIAEEQYEQRRQEEARAEAVRQKAQAASDPREMSAECREILREGREYLAHIHACNDAIPGEEMSEKLSRLELIVSRIFAQVEQHPDLADDLHKMMSYYLPTTRKLIDAYVDLDNQPVEGSNIANTKKEIEHTLDTINQAFELLLDSLFQDKAWDISSDISVLNTMLAQEGLTKRDFS